MMLALVCASVVAVILRAPAPLEPVADMVMDRTPVPIAIPLLLRLGPLARPLALWGAVTIVLAVGGLLGRIAARPSHAPTSPVRGRWGRGGEGMRPLLAVGIVALLVMVAMPGGSPVVAAVLVVVFALALYVLGRRVPYAAARRTFLLHNGRIVVGTAVLIALLYVQPLAFMLRARAAGRPLFPWAPPRPRRPGFDLPGLTLEVTPLGQFYEMDEDLQRPDIELGAWMLAIEGLVRRPLQLRFADVLDMARRDEWVTQRCISNTVDGHWMSTALFSGVPIAALLARAGLVPGATAVLFHAADGHEEAIPLDLARDARVILAYAMDGRLLEQAHGFPARVLIPGLYGFKSVKWVDRIRVTRDPQQGFWEREGWSPLPWVQTVARIDVARPAREGLLVAGVAYAGRRGVQAVQVRAGDGPWRSAALHTPALSALTWIQWRLTMPAREIPRHGAVTLRARAVDGAGHVQMALPHDQQPAGATGYDTVTVMV